MNTTLRDPKQVELGPNGAHDLDDPPFALAIPVNPGKVARFLAIIAVCLALLSMLADHIEAAIGPDNATPLVESVLWEFGVNQEESIPTWFSTGLLLTCAGVLTIITLAKRAHGDRYTRRWMGLTLIFLYLSLDEAAALHESLTVPLEEALRPTGVLYFGWVIVYVPLVILFALVYLPFLFHLPSRTRNLVALAGMTYIGGAVIVEGISANEWYLNGGSNLLYLAIGTVEELFEMLGVIIFLYALLAYIERAQVDVQLQPQNQAALPTWPGIRARLNRGRARLKRSAITPALIVFFGGTNLILVQWVLVRELTALLLGTELVVLIVSVSYFVGLSVGYLLAGRIRRSWLPVLGVITLGLHLTLPIWFRLLVVGLNSIGAYWAAYLVLPLLTPFVVSAFYSIFLPLFVDSGEGQLPRLYMLELVGSALGVFALVLVGGLGLQIVYVIYGAGLLLILWALKLRPLLLAALGVATLGWLAVLPGAHFWSNALWYEQVQSLPPGTITLFSGYSSYQKVDVLEAPSGERYLFLDGLMHFGDEGTHRLDTIAGRVPASILWPRNALVVGAGSMEMAAMIAEYAGQVTTVEIDPMVVDASLGFFTPVNRMNTLTNRSIVIDDAKHFLANDEMEYGLIAAAPPAAYSLQPATLSTQSFYQTIREHLALDGVFVANMTSTFGPDDLISRRIAAGLLVTFDDVVVVTPGSVGWSFAYASDNLPFGMEVLEANLRANGETDYTILDTSAVRAIVGDAQPITLDSMDIVLQVSTDYLLARLQWR